MNLQKRILKPAGGRCWRKSFRSSFRILPPGSPAAAPSASALTTKSPGIMILSPGSAFSFRGKIIPDHAFSGFLDLHCLLKLRKHLMVKIGQRTPADGSVDLASAVSKKRPQKSGRFRIEWHQYPVRNAESAVPALQDLRCLSGNTDSFKFIPLSPYRRDRQFRTECFAADPCRLLLRDPSVFSPYAFNNLVLLLQNFPRA